MYLPPLAHIIKQMKLEKEKRNLSIPQIQKMCENEGLFISINTFRSIFGKGSEDGSYSYEHTIRPLAAVLLPKDWCVPDNRNSQTSVMEKQLELLTNQLIVEREAYKKQLGLLYEQVKYQTGLIKEKDQLIRELLKEVKK